MQSYGIMYWFPWIAQLSRDMGIATMKPISANLYITSPGVEEALRAHTDFMCSMMVQLSGRKRWRLWKKPRIWQPARARHIRGRDYIDDVPLNELGPPYIDAVLEPGDILSANGPQRTQRA